MSIILIGIWLGLLQVLVKTGVLKGWSLWMKLSPIAIYLIYFVVIAIPMNFTAPTGAVMVMRDSVQISPAVPGRVSKVPVSSGTDVAPGSVLLELDDTPYKAAVGGLKAQLELAQTRLAQSQELVERGTGRAYDVQQYEAQVDQVTAQLAAAQWNLEQTSVLAPSEGFVPHVAVQPGTQVAPGVPVMTFIDSGEVALAAQIDQVYARHINPGQKADVVLKLYPGTVLKATVRRVLDLTTEGQMAPSGIAMGSEAWKNLPFLVELELDDELRLADLPAGSFGTVAIYTSDMASFGELIRAIMLRTETWLNYL